MNKTVLITGAAKGIGAEIARRFAKEGYNVCINYNTSYTKAKELLDELSKYKIQVLILKADITKREQVNKMIKEVLDNFGKIDVLVNNAGISEYKLFIDLTYDDVVRMLNTSIVGTFNVTQEVLKKSMIKEKNGKIINISSIWGISGASLEVNYSTAKAGIIGMTKALAKELAPSNITVNAVAPSAIYTDMLNDFTDEEIKNLENEIPLGRIGNTNDISGCVYFLASEDARYITGQVISPNGGFVI